MQETGQIINHNAILPHREKSFKTQMDCTWSFTPQASSSLKIPAETDSCHWVFWKSLSIFKHATSFLLL